MKFDLHTHHDRCGHAEGKIEQYIQSALKQGLKAIGISDHSPFFGMEEDQPLPGIAMAKSEFPHYIKEVLELKKKYEGQIDVLLGVESDFFPEYAEVYRQVYSQYPLDYIIGSVHYVEGITIFNRKRWDQLDEAGKIRLKDKYHDLIVQSARSGMFDILGHIDAMKGRYPEFSEIPSRNLEKAIKAIGECDMTIEINTSGSTKDVGGWYPSDHILELALHSGVKVTMGSDAHIPGRVADEFEFVTRRLKEIGFHEWVYFKERKRISVPL
ncbi:histidinol-phosphatase [Paenibacillus nasutitermitis]|nr:histidinol-phosphatase [Paenibacillus nasutitermitis]